MYYVTKTKLDFSGITEELENIMRPTKQSGVTIIHYKQQLYHSALYISICSCRECVIFKIRNHETQKV